MFLNNTSKPAAMSAQTSQAAPISTSKFNRPNKRRRSPEPPESERPALRSGADSSNGQISPASEREDERYLSNTARNHNENVAHKDRRQRVSGELNLVHNNGVYHPSDQKETRQPPAKTIRRSSTNATVPTQDQPRIGIVTLQPVVFGIASSRPNALRSSKLDGHITPPTSPIEVPVAEMTNIDSSPPNIDNEMLFRSFQSFEEDGTVFRPSRLASYDAQVTVNEPWQCQEFSQGDETTLREFNNHQELPPDAGIVTTSGVTSTMVPIVPSWIAENSRYSIGIDMAYRGGYDPEHPRNYEHYIARFSARPAYPRAKEYEYCPMPEILDVEMTNQRLNWVVPDDGEAPRRLRELPVPPPHIDSELARCVRFAQSDAQRRVDWRAHPSHVAEIIRRTNFYGMELLISREYMRISCPPTIDEFELAMATRLAHASFGKDPVAYIAADVRALADYLVRDIPSAMCLTLNDEEDLFSNFSRFYRAEFADKHPPFDEIGLPTWRLLLKGEMGIPSLRAQSLRAIIDSIEEQTAQALIDGRNVCSLASGVSDEDAHLNNESATNYSPCSDLDHNLGGSNVDGGFGWTIGEFNADLSDVDCIRGWDEFSASLHYQSKKEGALGEFLDPVYAAVDGGALEPMADLDPSQTFWSNQSSSVPSDCAQDMSAPVINVFSFEASTVESFFRQ